MKKRISRMLMAALAAIFFCGGMAAHATTLTGTVNNPDGSPFNGVIYLTLSQSATVSSAGTCGGPLYVSNSYRVGVQVVAGVVTSSPQIYDSNCFTTPGIPYSVQLVSSTGAVVSQIWVVTSSPLQTGSENVGTIIPLSVSGTIFQLPAAANVTSMLFGSTSIPLDTTAPSGSTTFLCAVSGKISGCAASAGSMTWPSGGAGIPNYNGGSGYGTTYNSSNPIPSNFLSLALQSGTTATTQTAGDNSTKVATDAFVLANGSGLPGATAAGQGPVYNGSAYVAGQIAPVPGSYTFYEVGSTYYARNNNTMAVDYSGTDAGVVINAAIANIAGTCGTLHFQPAVYSINSLTQETASGFTQVYYGIRIPAIASSGQYCQWNVTGDSNAPLIDAFGTGVQTGGVVFNITSTAVSGAPGASTADIVGIWQQPPASPGPAASDFLSNFDVRFPNNQRGSETAVDMTQALNVHYKNVVADTAVAQSSLAFPVAGTYGMYGLTTTLSVHEENTMELSYAIGYDHALDIESEHTVLIHSYGIDCDYAIDYGVRGTSIIQHNSVFIDSGWGECAHGLTIGANVSNGATLDIVGLDVESAVSGIWVPVYHGKEVNPGRTSGTISYSNALYGGGYGSANLFDGTSGTGSKLNVVTSANSYFPNVSSSQFTLKSYSGDYAGVTLQNDLTSWTSNYEFGSGYIGETTYGVATKWFIYDAQNSKMRMAGDLSGNINIGYTTPYPTTFPALFSVGTAGQFQVNGSGDVTLSGCAGGSYVKADGTGCGTPSGSGGTTTNAVTFNNGGAGAASGSTFDGSAALTISYNTLGAAPLANPVFTGTVRAPAVNATQFTANSSSAVYAGYSLQNAATGSQTANYEFGTGYIGETTYGVATKWFIYDAQNSAMRMAGDLSGNINIGYTTPYPTTFPALFSVGSSGQFQVTALGAVTAPSLNGLTTPTPAGNANFTQTINAGTAAMEGGTAVASGACATTVTVASASVVTTDVITAGFNSDPTGVTGYVPGASLTIVPFPTAGNVNFKLCNYTASSITPTAITINWRVQR